MGFRSVLTSFFASGTKAVTEGAAKAVTGSVKDMTGSAKDVIGIRRDLAEIEAVRREIEDHDSQVQKATFGDVEMYDPAVRKLRLAIQKEREQDRTRYRDESKEKYRANDFIALMVVALLTWLSALGLSRVFVAIVALLIVLALIVLLARS